MNNIFFASLFVPMFIYVYKKKIISKIIRICAKSSVEHKIVEKEVILYFIYINYQNVSFIFLVTTDITTISFVINKCES